MGYGDDTFEILVMKEYKLHLSWTNTLAFSFSSIRTHYFFPILVITIETD